MGLKKYFVRKMLNRWEENDKRKLAGKTLPTGIIEVKDVPYCDDGVVGHLLDIYYPESLKGKLPVIIDLHGGGFMSSYKELNKLYGYHLAKKGFLVFNLNYRLGSDTKVPGQIRDVAMAAGWIRERLEQYNGDCDNVFIFGHSAGGVLAVMEALTSESQRIRELFQIPAGGSLHYKGIAIDCGMMTFYENTIGYWGMRTMCLDKGYRKKEYYRNMIWDKIPELKSLPKIYLISNEKDELKHMTLEFHSILERNNVEHVMNFQCESALGHMAVIYDPDSEGCCAVIDDMIEYLLV